MPHQEQSEQRRQFHAGQFQELPVEQQREVGEQEVQKIKKSLLLGDFSELMTPSAVPYVPRVNPHRVSKKGWTTEYSTTQPKNVVEESSLWAQWNKKKQEQEDTFRCCEDFYCPFHWTMFCTRTIPHEVDGYHGCGLCDAIWPAMVQEEEAHAEAGDQKKDPWESSTP